MLLANEDAAGVQNFDQHRNATGSMLLSSVGDGRLEIGLTFASALFSGPSLSKMACGVFFTRGRIPCRRFRRKLYAHWSE